MGNIEIFTPHYNKKIRGFAELTLDNGVERKVIESENTFCENNISKFLQSMGRSCQGVDIDLDWTTVVGGIFLFDDTVPANSKYMPASARMVGNAYYNYENAGNPPEMGSFVSHTATSNSLEVNYTWDSSHGNGIIKCVSLTSMRGGQLGYGNYSGTYLDTKYRYNVSDRVDTIIQGGYHYKDYGYIASINDNVLTVIKTPQNITKINIFPSSEPITHELTLDAPNAVTGIGQDGKIFFFLSFYNWEPNAQCRTSLVIYDIETDTVTERYLTNNSNITFRGSGTGWPCTDICGLNVKDNEIFIKGEGTTSVIRINYLTDALIDTLDTNDTYLRIAPDLYAITPWNNNGDGRAVVYNAVTKTRYIQNGTPYCIFGSWNHTHRAEFDVDSDMFLPSASNYDYYTGSDGVAARDVFYTNPLYLATINNLETPVSKTDSDILNVKYTLVVE